MTRALPVLAVLLALVVVWYAGAVWLNAAWVLDRAEAAGRSLGWLDLIGETWTQDRPRLPAPHQVATELWSTTVRPCYEGRRAWSVECLTHPRNLTFHAWVTLSATLLGFAIGTALGIVLAVAIVQSRVMERSVMPWVIASQTIPIVALAPMILGVLNGLQMPGLVSKGVIAAYLSFFPVTVGMVAGLRAPSAIQRDAFRTWSASAAQTMAKLRFPAALPYLFASLKIGIAAALVGTIVGELPTGAVAGLGARLLAGSYYGNTAQLWSALLMAALVAGLLIALLGWIERRATGWAR